MDDYTYYKLSGGNKLKGDEDCNTLPTGIAWVYSGAESSTLSHRPLDASASACEIITESQNGNAESVRSQTWKQRTPVREWRRTSTTGIWTDWVEYATVERGTWTPTCAQFAFLSTDTCTYCKVGNLCFLYFYGSARKGTSADRIVISGLPFSFKGGAVVFNTYSGGLSFDGTLNGYVNQNRLTLRAFTTRGIMQDMTNQSIAATGAFVIGFTIIGEV